MIEFWQGKKVLVTGHTGFKGTWICHWLNELGAEVSGFALPPSTVPSIFKLTNLEDKIDSHIGDITDRDAIEKVLVSVQPEIVIHMAAQPLVIDSYDDPVGTYMTNVIGTAHVFEAIRRAKSVKAVVNVTTDKCYENKEWNWGYRENEAMGGFDPYSSSKGCSELLTASYRQSFFNNENIKLASGRAGNVIGGGDWSENRLVPDLVSSISKNDTAIIRNPNSIRPWQHVLEPIYGYLKLAEKLHGENGEAFLGGWNFGPHDSGAQPVSWIADRLCKKWGDGADWKLDNPDDVPLHEAKYLKLDCSKARAELGWEPKLDLETTIDWIVDWHKTFESNGDIEAKTIEQIQRFQSKI